MVAETPADRTAREAVRQRERAIWSDVERIGHDLRAGDAAKQDMTQADRDIAARRLKENQSE